MTEKYMIIAIRYDDAQEGALQALIAPIPGKVNNEMSGEAWIPYKGYIAPFLKEIEDTDKADCCKEHDGPRYLDPPMGYTHSRKCMDNRIKFLKTLDQGTIHKASGLTIIERIKQLKKAMEE